CPHSPHTIPFHFPHPPPPYIYTLSLHDALPIFQPLEHSPEVAGSPFIKGFQCFNILCREQRAGFLMNIRFYFFLIQQRHTAHIRSEEHTSELQSRFDLVCRLLLEKKK